MTKVMVLVETAWVHGDRIFPMDIPLGVPHPGDRHFCRKARLVSTCWWHLLRRGLRGKPSWRGGWSRAQHCNFSRCQGLDGHVPVGTGSLWWHRGDRLVPQLLLVAITRGQLVVGLSTCKTHPRAQTSVCNSIGLLHWVFSFSIIHQQELRG